MKDEEWCKAVVISPKFLDGVRDLERHCLHQYKREADCRALAMLLWANGVEFVEKNGSVCDDTEHDRGS